MRPQWRSKKVGRVGKVQAAPSAGGPEFQAKKIKIIFPLEWVKLLTDLHILGCELLKNAFGGRAPPVPAR